MGLTLVKIRRRRLALLLELALSVLFVRVISLYVVPRVELEDVVTLVQVPTAKLEGIGPLLVILGVVRPMGRDVLWLFGLASLVEGEQ